MAITLNGTTGITTPALDSSGPLTSLGIDDNATSTAITIDASNNVGIGTSSPSGYDSRANNLVVGDAGDAGITIFSGATSNARLQFAPSGSTGLDNGLIGYDNSNDLMVFATGGSDRMRIDSAGRVTMPYQPAFMAGNASGSTTIANNTWLTVPLTTTKYNVGGHFNTSTYTFTAPVAGLYAFKMVSTFTTSSTYQSAGGNDFQLQLHVNGAIYRIGNGDYGGNAVGYFAASTRLSFAILQAGDSVTMQVFQNEGFTATIQLGMCNFSGYLVG